MYIYICIHINISYIIRNLQQVFMLTNSLYDYMDVVCRHLGLTLYDLQRVERRAEPVAMQPHL